MREILFRGKRTDNGEWVEGFLIKDFELYGRKDEHSYIVNHKHPSGCFGNDIYFEVIPETVGQYTGLTDKNGKKIFEGDIVDVEYDIQYVGVASDRIGLFVVVFADGCFMKQKQGGGLFHFISSDKCKVIGNIYDNPELLKGDGNAGKSV